VTQEQRPRNPGQPTPTQLLETANLWESRAEEHIRGADFCKEQAARIMARIAVPDDYRPTLTLIDCTDL
jgi:hypothetical protein